MLLNVKLQMKTRVCPRPFLTIRATGGLPRLWGHCHADSGGLSEGPPMKREHKVGRAVFGFAVLVIVGIVTGCGKATPTGNISPVASASALASTVASPTFTATSAPTPAAAATKAKPKPLRTAAPVRTAAASITSKAAAPSPKTTAPSAASTTSSGCYPLTNGGNCYEPGEYCRNSDHGVSGVAGDGERITCEDNNGWRWEPA
jgi:hypothetical protein